jgi:hypothetical protein
MNFYKKAMNYNTSIQNPSGTTQNDKGSKMDNWSIIELRYGTNHPCSLLYSEIYNNALLTGKLAEGRSQPGFSLKGKSPFVLAAKSAILYGIEREDVVNTIEKVLFEYYETVRPKSATEWLGLDISPGNKLAQSPPWAAVFPWRARTLESYQQAYEMAALKENNIVQTSTAPLDITKGWLFCGPCSSEKIRIEALRINYVLKQISKEGFRRSNQPEGDVKATALVDNSDRWRWLITAGNHRASAASALGYDEIPIRVNLVIRRGDVKFWPNVVNGLYTEAQALKIFDQYFDAVTPPVTNHWLLSTSDNKTIELNSKEGAYHAE